MKQCKKCGKMKPESKFYSKGKDRRGNQRRETKCSDCNKRLPSTSKKQWLKNVYGLSLDEYEEMLSKQNHSCAICFKDNVRLSVDHCHITGKVRGLLCQHCNSGIGFLKDDPELVRAALQYLSYQEEE